MKKYLQRFLAIAICISSLLYFAPQITSAEEAPQIYSLASRLDARDMGVGGSGGGKAFFNAAAAGGRTASHSSTSSVSSLPTRGKEFTSVDLISRGILKQRRYYGIDGKAYKDIDYTHGGNGNYTFPHIHTWKWIGDDGDRSKH